MEKISTIIVLAISLLWVSAFAASPLAGKIIALDAGHGGGEIGAVNKKYAVAEADVNWDVVRALKAKLEAVTQLVPYLRLVERERLRIPFKSEEEFDTFFTSDEFNRLFNELIVDKLAISQIMLLLRERPLSTGKISEILGLTPSEVARHMNSSSRQGLVRYDEGRKRFALA